MLPMTGEKIVLSNIKLSDLIKVKKLASDTCCILGVYDKLSGEIAGYVSIYIFKDAILFGKVKSIKHLYLC